MSNLKYMTIMYLQTNKPASELNKTAMPVAKVVPKFEVVHVGDYVIVIVGGLLLLTTSYIIYLVRTNWLHQSKITSYMTLFLASSLSLQICNSLQFIFDFPIAVNDAYNLCIYSYMGLIMVTGILI
jgi:hypothetical protein